MLESETLDYEDYTNPAPRLPESPVWMILLAQLGLLIFCSAIGMFLYTLIGKLAGWDLSLMLNSDSTLPERWQFRVQLGLGHFFGFFVSGALTVWIFYRGITQSRTSWPDYLNSRHWPGFGMLGLGVLLMAVSVPLVMYSLNINQLVQLPEIFKVAEEQTANALKGLLHMDSVSEMLANVVIIALLPALGEELVFRGVIQQQLMRRISNPWWAIALSAMIFSAAHMQFEGFLPRMLLGFLLGWLYWQTRNFWVPVAGHFFNNGLQVVAQYLYGKEMSTVDLEKDVQVPWEFAAMSAFMVWAVMRLIISRGVKTP